jgi:hypothetical protein
MINTTWPVFLANAVASYFLLPFFISRFSASGNFMELKLQHRRETFSSYFQIARSFLPGYGGINFIAFMLRRANQPSASDARDVDFKRFERSSRPNGLPASI